MMTAPAKFLLPTTSIPRPSPSSSVLYPRFLASSSSLRSCRYRGRRFPLPGVASVPFQPINVDYLEEEFDGRGHGVSFEAVGDEFLAKLQLQTGASAIVMLPSGLITSYKPPMWHGGSIELLHSSVFQEKNGDLVVRGGISFAFHCETDSSLPTPRNWALHNISGNPSDSIQVELISSDSGGTVVFKSIVTLREDMLSSELIVSNNKQTYLNLMGCILSHLTVSTPEATYAVGLERSNFYNTPPFSPNVAIIPPDYGDRQTRKGILSGWGRGHQNNADETSDSQVEGEETENYKQLTAQMSRIYTSAPRNFTIIDRGRRNSVVVGRDGLDEVYMMSPGSKHVYYGEYSYICVGQSAILKPIELEPQQVWRGSQHLYNPNL